MSLARKPKFNKIFCIFWSVLELAYLFKCCAYVRGYVHAFERACVRVCVCVCACCTCGGELTVHWSSIMWVLGVELRSSGFTIQLSVLPENYLLSADSLILSVKHLSISFLLLPHSPPLLGLVAHTTNLSIPERRQKQGNLLNLRPVRST